MSISIKSSPFLKDMAWTTGTSFLTVLSFVLVTRILANAFGPNEFGAYSLARRILAILEPLTTCNMGIALARYAAINTEERESYFFSGLLLSFIPSILLIILSFIFRNQLAILIFKDLRYISLLQATFLLVFGYSCFVVLYGYYRGIGKTFQSNLWQIVLIAIVPLVIAINFATSFGPDKIIFLNFLSFIFVLIPIIIILFKALLVKKILLFNKVYFWELFRYGFFRIPVFFAYGGILSFGIFLSPYFCSLKSAGYLVIGMSVLRIIEGCIDSFSRVSLPIISKFSVSGNKLFLKEKIIDLLNFIFHIGLFASLHILLWSDQIILIWLGRSYVEAVPVVNIFSISVIPFVFYSMLKTVIDAVEVKAINANNLYQSFTITIVVCFILAKLGMGIIGLAIGTVLGIFVLAILTMRYIFLTFKIGASDFVLRKCFFLNIVLFLLAAGAKSTIIRYSSGIALSVYIVTVEMLLFLLYCFSLYLSNIRWVREMTKRIWIR